MLIGALLPSMPASAAAPAAIGISISESINRHDTYQPQDPSLNGTVANGTVSGSGVITITNNAGKVLNNVDLVFTPGHTLSNWSRWANDTVSSVVSSGEVKIASFPIGGVVHVNYTLDPATAVPPVTLSATYSANNITNSLTSNTVVFLVATLNASALPSDVTSVASTVSVTSADNASRGTQNKPDWVLNSSAGNTSPTSMTSISWSPALSTTQTQQTLVINATVNDVAALNDNGNGVSLQGLATSTVTYTITSSQGSSSGITLSSATAISSEVQSDITKQFINNQWVFTPKVSVPSNSTLTYSLSSVTEWAVDNSNLGTPISLAGLTNPLTINATGAHASETWPVTIDATHPWTGTGSELLQFAYSGIPVGFIKPIITISGTPAEFAISPNGAASSSQAYPNGVYLVKSIYIINGYKVEVVKTITPDASTSGLYHIKIVATNTGTMATPPNVYIYDIIPAAFYTAGTSPSNILVNNAAPSGISLTQKQQLTSGPNNGDWAYFWNIGSLAVSGSATITYDVTGSGSYDATNLYVVGVDPAQSVNQQTTPSLTNEASIVNSNYDSLAAIGAFGIVLIGMFGTVRRKL